MVLAEEKYVYQGWTDPPIVGGGSRAYSFPGETLWYLADHLGSVRGVVDNDGVTRQHLSYDSFGNRAFDQNYSSTGTTISSTDKLAVDVIFGYTGRFWDTDIGLQSNRARWYDPAQGRWISQDPIGFAAGDANLYRYVGNGPTWKTDPSGLEEGGGLAGWLDRNFRDPLRNWLNRNLKHPVNEFVDEKVQPIAEGFKQGGRGGAYVIGKVITLGLDERVNQCTDDAWKRAQSNGDYVTQVGFYGGMAGAMATQALVIPGGGSFSTGGGRAVSHGGVSELYVHTWQVAWRGNTASAGMGGRIWATPYSGAELANMSRFQRLWHIGRGKLPNDSICVTGDALDEFVRVRGIGPFRLAWKRAGGQYFSKGPGSIDLTTGVRTADLGARLRYAAMSTGSYTMDGLLVGSIGGSIYAYANGGWGSVFDTFFGNSEPVGD